MNINNLGSMSVPSGQRAFTIPWNHDGQRSADLTDLADAKALVAQTDEIVVSHTSGHIPDYMRAFSKKPLWSEDIDPSRSNDMRILEQDGNVYRSQATLEPGPSGGYRKTSFRLADDKGQVGIRAEYKDGKIIRGEHTRNLENGTRERVAFEINQNGTLTYTSESVA
jgi:hypothetical protein